ncbi:right-handed parallel beta-helix repeat-containing protein [Marinilactibacillus psychrotolerans]|uniref:right-handed parallel beta-helix repeat-containing protein n=1 Tax=Marinilactibacillus psychrotolerans TaxID=191770 RepID=UPI0038895660
MAVDPIIQQKADDIRQKIYGEQVRESLASGLEAMSSDVVEVEGRQDEVEGRQDEVEGRQDEVEEQFQNVIENTTDKDVISAPELIAARNGEPNLKARLDKENQEVTAQLAQNTNYLKYTGVNIAQFEREDTETNDNGRLERAITQAMSDGTHVVINEDIVVGDFENTNHWLTVVGTGNIIKDENATGILTLNGDYVVINGLGFNSFNPIHSVGFLLRIKGKHSTVTHNRFNDKAGSKEFIGLEMGEGSGTGIITENHFNNCAYMFFMSNGSKNMTVTANTFNGGYQKPDYSNDQSVMSIGDGIKLSRDIGGEYVLINNNVFENIYRDAIDCFTSGVYVDFSHNICRNIQTLIADIKTIYRGTDTLDSSNPDKPSKDIVIAYNICELNGQGLPQTSAFYVGHINHTSFPEYDNEELIVQNVRIEHNKVISRKNAHIIRTGKLNGLTISDNEFEAYNTLSYIWLRAEAKKIRVFDNLFKNVSSTPRLLYLTDVSDVLIDRNTFDCLNLISVSAIAVSESEDVCINNNNFKDNSTFLNINGSENTDITNNKMTNASIAIRYGAPIENKAGNIKNNKLVNGTRFIIFSNINDRILFTDNISFNVDNTLDATYGNKNSLTNSIERNNELINTL